MSQYNQPDSDIDETPMVIQVRCTECGQVEEEHIIAEDLDDYIPHDDGTYESAYSECTKCIRKSQLSYRMVGLGFNYWKAMGLETLEAVNTLIFGKEEEQ